MQIADVCTIFQTIRSLTAKTMCGIPDLEHMTIYSCSHWPPSFSPQYKALSGYSSCHQYSDGNQVQDLAK
jgi:hypothetical protein